VIEKMKLSGIRSLILIKLLVMLLSLGQKKCDIDYIKVRYTTRDTAFNKVLANIDSTSGSWDLVHNNKPILDESLDQFISIYKYFIPMMLQNVRLFRQMEGHYNKT
jgi:hypothetical protein